MAAWETGDAIAVTTTVGMSAGTHLYGAYLLTKASWVPVAAMIGLSGMMGITGLLLIGAGAVIFVQLMDNIYGIIVYRRRYYYV